MRRASESVLITGTTSGVGRALLDHYARSGVHVVSVNRRRVPELESMYPRIRFECIDVGRAEDVDGLVRDLAASGRLPEVFLLNAGINRIDNDESFDLEAYKDVLHTNLFGALGFVAPLTRLEPRPPPRHIVAISSMAAYVGNPYGLGYHTSKKALSAAFDVWARMYAGSDLFFQQVLLGPVRTGMFTMAARLPAWMGRLRELVAASPDDAARAIAGFVRTRRRRLLFPRRALPLYVGMGIGQRLVPGFFQGRATLDGKPRSLSR